MILYANENNGNFPRTTYDPTDPTPRTYTGAFAKDPFAANGPRANDVTAAFFLLLRTQDNIYGPGQLLQKEPKRLISPVISGAINASRSTGMRALCCRWP